MHSDDTAGHTAYVTSYRSIQPNKPAAICESVWTQCAGHCRSSGIATSASNLKSAIQHCNNEPEAALQIEEFQSSFAHCHPGMDRDWARGGRSHTDDIL